MPILDGIWYIYQGNGNVVTLQTQRQNETFYGTATSGSVNGTVAGTLGALSGFAPVQMTINWQNGAVGLYYGISNPADGRWTGITCEQDNATSNLL
jgi:hypothetical protein